MNYKLFPKSSSPGESINQQRRMIIDRIHIQKTVQNAQLLEERLNQLFYAKKGDDYEKYYDRAIKLASAAFEERYQEYPFELDSTTLTAHFANKDVHFLNKDTAKLQEVKQVAKAVEALLERTGKSNDRTVEILSKIAQLQNLSEWKDVQSLNGIIASIMFGNKTIYGDAFEYALSAFSTVVNNSADKTINELLDEFAKNQQGASRSSSYFDISHVSKQDRKDLHISGTVPINEGAELVYKNTTQDKVDVILNLDGVQYNVSAKSYYNTSEIGILGGASLLQPVINLSSVNFVSWYLSALYDEKYGANLLPEIHDTLRINILLMALTGQGDSHQNLADTFILNDKARKHIYVRTIYDLIYNMITSNKIVQYMIINDNGSNIPDESLRNFQSKLEPNATNKVASMLNAMHQIKLNVALKGRAIRDISN